MHTFGFTTFLVNIWVEESFWGCESWLVNIYNLAIWELIGFLEFGGFASLLLVSSKVKGHIAERLLHASNNL